MRADAAQADRNGSIRAAARAWHKAGAIPEESLKAIEAAVPDDRYRVGPVFRVLLFVFTVFAASAAFGFAFLVLGSALTQVSPREEGVFAFVALAFGVGLAILTEFQLGSLKRSQGGTEAGTSFCALSFFLGGLAWFVFEPFQLADRSAMLIFLGIAALLLALASWRWGYAFYAGCAAASLLAALTFLPAARLMWIVLPLAAAPFLLRLSESPRLPPALRHAATAALVVGLVALYIAVHLGSFDFGALEIVVRDYRDLGPAVKSSLLRLLSIAATALVPAIVLAIGIRTRRTVFLLLGIATSAASLVTLRFYVHLAPLWVVLTGSGAALVALVFALRRLLEQGPDKERGGFTAEPLFEDLARRRLLEAGAALASFTPDARPAAEEPRFTGGGGEFGGGGSSSQF